MWLGHGSGRVPRSPGTREPLRGRAEAPGSSAAPGAFQQGPWAVAVMLCSEPRSRLSPRSAGCGHLTWKHQGMGCKRQRGGSASLRTRGRCTGRFHLLLPVETSDSSAPLQWGQPSTPEILPRCIPDSISGRITVLFKNQEKPFFGSCADFPSYFWIYLIRLGFIEELCNSAELLQFLFSLA